jgi:hypothetical protein
MRQKDKVWRRWQKEKNIAYTKSCKTVASISLCGTNARRGSTGDARASGSLRNGWGLKRGWDDGSTRSRRRHRIRKLFYWKRSRRSSGYDCPQKKLLRPDRTSDSKSAWSLGLGDRLLGRNPASPNPSMVFTMISQLMFDCVVDSSDLPTNCQQLPTPISSLQPYRFLKYPRAVLD